MKWRESLHCFHAANSFLGSSKQSRLFSLYANFKLISLFCRAQSLCLNQFISIEASFKMDAGTAQKNWEVENNITTVDPAQDQIYFYDAAQDKENVAQKPWKNE